MALIKCPECGNNVSDKAKACPNCGFPVKDIISKKTCPECGNEVSDKVKACPNCGFPFEESLSENQSDRLSAPVSNTSVLSVVNTAPAPSYSYNEESSDGFDSIARPEKSKVTNTWFWLLTILVPIAGFVLTLLGLGIIPTLIIMVIANCVLVSVDNSSLHQQGVYIKKVWVYLGLIVLVPFYIVARAVKTKCFVPVILYIVFFVLDIMASFGLISFTESGDFVNYVNVQMKDFTEIEDKMITCYNTYVVGRSLSDATVYHYISDVLLPYADDLAEEALSVQKNIKGKELEELHSILIDYCDAWVGMLTNYKKVVDYGDMTYYSKGQEYESRLSDLLNKYRKRSKELAEKYNVVLYER